MNLNDRFPVADDDTVGPFTCCTCGASVADRDAAERHNDWHDDAKALRTRLHHLANDWEALTTHGGNISTPVKTCLKQCVKELRLRLRSGT